LSSRSIFRWPSTPPAASRVVPRAEKKMLGGGVTEESFEAHSEVSAVTSECNFGSVEVGSRRAREWTEVIEGRERRAERRWEP